MKWIMVLVITLVVAVMLPDRGFAQDSNTASGEIRTWTDNEDKSTFRAELVSCDMETKLVILRLDEDTVAEMPVADLSMADRRFLSRYVARKKREAKRQNWDSQHGRNQQLAGVVVPDVSPQRSKANRHRSNDSFSDGVQQLYGIAWHQTPESAQTAARGGESPDDDKMVIWFRVLGEMSGGM